MEVNLNLLEKSFAILKDEDISWKDKCNAIESIKTSSQKKVAEQLLIDLLLTHQNAFVREEAALALSQLKTVNSLRALRQAKEDGSNFVRRTVDKILQNFSSKP